MSNVSAEIGVIGGSGLYQIEKLKVIEEVKLETPFGSPSGPYVVGSIDGVKVAFLPRHGKGHRLLPHELNFRANIYGFKMMGVKYLVSLSAVGSLKEELRPRDIAVVDQFIDRTRHRVDTFFGNGIVAHISFGDPTCSKLGKIVSNVCSKMKNLRYTEGCTYVCMEGPQFSTKAESNLYRSWGADVIGMTALTEAKLAREAEIAYTVIAGVTDYDCWKDEIVTVSLVIDNLRANSSMLKQIMQEVVAAIAFSKPISEAHSALKNGLMTNLKTAPRKTIDNLKYILEPYL